MSEAESWAELPGAEWVLPGLQDWQRGKGDTVEALLVAIAATRLRQAGLPVPSGLPILEPELRLYGLLTTERPDAYAYYNALLRRLDRFCRALERVQPPPNTSTLANQQGGA